MRSKRAAKLRSILGTIIVIAIIAINFMNTSEYGKALKAKLQTMFGNIPFISQQAETSYESLGDIPQWDGEAAYAVINDDDPQFSDEDIEKGKSETWLNLSSLDILGRCGESYSCLNASMMPKEERGPIGHVRPSGWHTQKYDRSVISDLYLYNRAHLQAFSLTGLNDDVRNLITGTRFMNLNMTDYEIPIAQYLEKNPDNHVLYRVTPIFNGSELVARGVHVEAMSIEDSSIRYNRYLYNEQPKIRIDHLTGNSELIE